MGRRLFGEQTGGTVVGTRSFVQHVYALPGFQDKVSEVKGDLRSCSYYTCGQPHNNRNANWKPFKHLEAYCKKEGLYLLGILERMENCIGRRVDCECEILNDEKEVKRRRLWVAFGMDFGESGNRDMDVV